MECWSSLPNSVGERYKIKKFAARHVSKILPPDPRRGPKSAKISEQFFQTLRVGRLMVKKIAESLEKSIEVLNKKGGPWEKIMGGVVGLNLFWSANEIYDVFLYFCWINNVFFSFSFFFLFFLFLFLSFLFSGG